jgi:rare lipoprotein A
LAILAAGGLSACASTHGPLGAGGGERAYNRPYEIHGHWYRPEAQPGYDEVGTASWYSYESHNRTTADGEVFDARLSTAAHKTLPIPSYLEVTNLGNGRRIRVRLNDRGPFVAGRIIDLSRAAAVQLGFYGQGTARVRVRYLGPAPLRPGDAVATARISASPPDGDE